MDHVVTGDSMLFCIKLNSAYTLTHILNESRSERVFQPVFFINLFKHFMYIRTIVILQLLYNLKTL